MIKKTTLGLTIASASVAALLGTAPNFAQAEGFSLEEIIVTARKREESLQDVPVAVSSFNSEDLAAYNMTETKDLSAFTPSLFIENNAASNLSSAKTTIRGQVQSDTLGTLDPSVGWYVDDVYLARTTGTIASLFDLERIEVLKGPQGTLYGRNTTGGAIKLITTKADPSADFNGFVTAGIGSFGANKIGGAVNIPIVEDKFALRVSALSDQIDDGIGSVLVTPTAVAGLYPGNTNLNFAPHRRDAGQKDVELVRVNGVWNATEDLTVNVTYEKSDSYFNALLLNTVDPQGFSLAGLPPVPLADIYDGGVVNALQESWAEHELLSITLDYEINENLATKLVYANRDLETSFMSDVDGSPLPLNYFLKPFEQNSEQSSLEWQLTGSAFDEKVDWIAGLFFFEEEGIDFSTSNGAGSIPSGILAGSYNGTIDKNKSRSAFISGTYHINDKLNFTVGARRTKDEKPVSVNAEIDTFFGTFCRFDAILAPNANLSNCTWQAEDEYEYTSWNIGLDYQLNDDILLYAKSSRAFRAGGQNLRGLGLVTTDLVGNPFNPAINTFNSFEPEQVTDFELGMKGQFFDNSLQVNAAIFTMDYEDAQKSLLLPTPVGLTTFITNTSGATFDGVEIEAEWIITENFKLLATFGKINWDYESPTDYGQAVPEEEYTLRGNYLVSMSAGELVLDVNFSHRGEFLPNSSASRQELEASNGVVDEVDLWGARATFNHESTGLTFALWGSNLTDEEYTLSPLVLSTAANLYSMGVGTPRAYGLDVTFRF